MALPIIGCGPGEKGDFTGQTLLAYTAEELSNRTIMGICLSQETPDTKVFPDGVVRLTLVRCALQNCAIPAGVTVGAECDVTRFLQFVPDKATYLGATRPDGAVDVKVNALNKPLTTAGNLRPMTPQQFTENAWSMVASHYKRAVQIGEV